MYVNLQDRNQQLPSSCIHVDKERACKKMANSLKDYYDLVFWINYSVYFSYFVIKYLIAPPLWGVLECADRRVRNGQGGTCLGKFAKITNSMQSVVLLIFGKQLAVKQFEATDSNKVHDFNLRKNKLSYGATMVLFVLIASFVILAIGSALDLALLTVTHICSEDPQIDCFPQLIPGANSTGLPTIDTSQPTEDCTIWDRFNASDGVTFVCYEYEFNVELFLAIFGGLLAFFIYTVKTVIALMMFLSVCCLGGFESDSKGEKGCKRCLYAQRIVVAVLVSIVEIALAILCLVLGATGTNIDNTYDSPGLIFLSMHSSELLVVFGILATLLWIPWEEFTVKRSSDGDNSQGTELENRA